MGPIEYQRCLFSKIEKDAPTHYPQAYFDLIFGISVFTHLSAIQQTQWIDELARICKTGGILLVTTMGAYFEKQLTTPEKIGY